MVNKWKILYGVIFGCMMVVMVMWWSLMGTVCSEPTVPNPETNQVIEFNCHGTIVYTTPIQDLLQTWLIPVEVILMAAAFTVKKQNRSQSTSWPPNED